MSTTRIVSRLGSATASALWKSLYGARKLASGILAEVEGALDTSYETEMVLEAAQNGRTTDVLGSRYTGETWSRQGATASGLFCWLVARINHHGVRTVKQALSVFEEDVHALEPEFRHRLEAQYQQTWMADSDSHVLWPPGVGEWIVDQYVQQSKRASVAS